MPVRVIIRQVAEADITDAAMWYEQQKVGLGVAFISEVDRTILVAASNPRQFPCLRRKPEVRRALTHRFPYRIFFIRQTTAIIVIRVLHGARDDGHWQRSVGSNRP